MAPPRIDEIDGPPVVGEFYLVPTVRYRWWGNLADWPVHGPKHTDKEIIRFAAEHYHLDLRFLTARQWRLGSGGRPTTLQFQAQPLSCLSRSGAGTEPHPDPVWKRRKCARRAPSMARFRAAAPWMPALETAYADRPCGRDAAGRLICPHKGADLSTIPPDERGVVTCPLHGLRVDLARGVVCGRAA